MKFPGQLEVINLYDTFEILVGLRDYKKQIPKDSNLENTIPIHVTKLTTDTWKAVIKNS